MEKEAAADQPVHPNNRMFTTETSTGPNRSWCDFFGSRGGGRHSHKGMSEAKTVARAGVSVKAQFVVVVGGQSYPVVVRYEPNEFVAQVKEFIVAKLKNTISVFKNIDLCTDRLTLKTLDGSLIVGNRIPEGHEFLAEIEIPQRKSFL